MVISLNTATKEQTIGGFPIVPYAETTRYLGIEVGTGDITKPNWTKRQQRVQAQLQRLATLFFSTEERTRILNTIILPGILFTAKYVTPLRRRLLGSTKQSEDFSGKERSHTQLGSSTAYMKKLYTYPIAPWGWDYRITKGAFSPKQAPPFCNGTNALTRKPGRRLTFCFRTRNRPPAK